MWLILEKNYGSTSFSFICKQKMTVEHSENCKLRSIFSKVISTFRIFHNFFPNFLELHLRTKNGKTAPYYNVSILKYSLCVFCCFFHFFSFSQWVKIVCFLSPSLILNLPWKKSTSRDLVAYLGERYYHRFDKHTQKLPLNSSYEKNDTNLMCYDY